jgi:hypothetical protein
MKWKMLLITVLKLLSGRRFFFLRIMQLYTFTIVKLKTTYGGQVTAVFTFFSGTV